MKPVCSFLPATLLLIGASEGRAQAQNFLVNGSFETWHAVSGQGWGTAEPDGWHGWELYPWDPWGAGHAAHISISMDRPTGIPNPSVKDGAHRVGMDEGWRSCYGGLYQELTGLAPDSYIVEGWVAWLFDGVQIPAAHRIEILARDGPHVAGAPPTGTVVWSQDGSASNLAWQWVQASVPCTTGQLTIYLNLRSDNWDGASFAHFDGFSVRAAAPPPVVFSGFEYARTVSGSAYDIVLSYETDVPTTTRVEWGPDTSYGNATTLDPALVTHHVVTLTGIAPAMRPYHFRAHATAPGVDAYSADRTFEAPLIVFGNLNSVVEASIGTVCTISWTTNFATTLNKVFYRETGAQTYAEAADAADPAPRTTHSVVLSGLTLGQSYEYYAQSGGADILAADSPVQTFETPAQPCPPVRIGMAMIGGSIRDGGDDVGPAGEVQALIERDHPMVNLSGMVGTSWAAAQPEDPGDGPNVYDWSELDRGAGGLIPGKALIGYYQMWGTSPGWVTQDTPRFWQKFEEFVEEMVVYTNGRYGAVYYIFENEPNISRAPAGWHWADWYIHCLRHFHAAVHRANARTGIDNKVIAGNLAGHSAGGFEELYARGLKDCSDLLGYHPYPYDLRAGVEVADLATIHATQVRYGDGAKKIYVSEGWGSGRSAGFDRSSPRIEPTAMEIENMYLALVKGWDNVMTPRENWHPDYLWGMNFFCGNDNWGARGWRARAIPQKDEAGNIIGFVVDGYWMTPDIAPYFYNGGMLDFYGNSKDCLNLVFPGHGLVFMNPGFELASDPPRAHMPHFWTAQADPPAATDYGLDDAVFRGGSRSLRLTPTGGDAGVWQMTSKRSVVPGLSYRARVWCRTHGEGGVSGRFYLRFCDAAGTAKSPPVWAAEVTGTTDWQLLQAIGTAPPYASRAEVGCLAGGTGTVWFDDVTISMTEQTESGTVRGYTLDEQQLPVGGCIVRTTTGGHQAVSGPDGYYEMPNVPSGTYDFVCRKAGYVPHRVRNQTVAAGKLTFVSFNMGVPKPGLAVTRVGTDRPVATIQADPVVVTVTVMNDRPYPNVVGEVGLFVEQGGTDTTELFTIRPHEANPRVIEPGGQGQFVFTLAPGAEAAGQSFQVNAYAYGQEDRPNMIENGGFDANPWDAHWSFGSGAPTLTWQPDSIEYWSPPRSLRCYVAGSDYSWNWAYNWSAYGAGATPAAPARSYTVGVHHKDNLTGGVSVDLFINEFYYDGTRWFYNGRRFAAIPQRSVWTHDVMIYETGDPNVTPGLYPTNRLAVAVGPCTTPVAGSGTNWWDDLYLKETGDWLADDRAAAGADVRIRSRQFIADFDLDDDTDINDFAHFQMCFNGASSPPARPGCADADIDNDGDVDVGDFSAFQACFSGSARPPTCD